ncbi:TPA: hypothetical protein I4D28_05385 [Enterobacter hormaechei]|nr:hypothetical protein [Enterobacter hormaechei]
MITLTKEWLLKTIAELEEERDAVPGVVNEDAAMALAAMKLALASLEAKDKIPELRQVIYHFRDWNEGFPVERFKADYVISWMLVNYPPAQPAPVSVPDERAVELLATDLMKRIDKITGERHSVVTLSSLRVSIVEACRAAMLQGAEPVTTANKLRDAVEIIRNSGIEIDAEKIFAERDALNTPDCWCRTCRPVTVSDMRFVVCPDCGNKRCPHANDHRNACTGSNEPGQEGSAYPAAPQQEVK